LLRLSDPGPQFRPTASVAAEGVTVDLDTAGIIDVAAERRRVDKDLAAARAEAEQARRKLANDSFLARAPGEVVAKTRDRLGARPPGPPPTAAPPAWPRCPGITVETPCRRRAAAAGPNAASLRDAASRRRDSASPGDDPRTPGSCLPHRGSARLRHDQGRPPR